MKKLVLICILFLPLSSLKSQSYIGDLSGISFGPEIPHPEIWSTSILGCANAAVSTLNILEMKNGKEKSNSGFYLFPGLVQLSMGVFFKKNNDPTRNIDIAIGSSSLLLTITRMVYPRKPKNNSVSFAPYYLPNEKNPIAGFSFTYKIK